MSGRVVGPEELEVVRDLISADAERVEAGAWAFDRMRERGEGFAVWIMSFGVMQELLRRLIRADPDWGYVRFVADLRCRYRDTWASDVRPLALERAVTALVDGTGEPFDATNADQGFDAFVALLMMLTRDAGLDPEQRDQLIDDVRVQADRALASPEMAGLVETYRVQAPANLATSAAGELPAARSDTGDPAT